MALAITPACAPLAAQRATAAATQDSARTLRALRGAQARFERTRRHHLPQEAGRGGSGCDMRIGRFCYWYDDTPMPSGWREEEPVIAGRRALLAALDSAARRFPGDAWILGQRVRYALDAHDDDRAREALRPCAAEPWRCAALTGLVHHVAGRYGASDSAFATALAAMPRAQRCAWEDIRLLLDGDAKRRYERAGCDERAALAAPYWWLARPLLASPANDLRTEWLARRTMVLLLRDAASTHESAWGTDEEELLLRFGWSTWFTRYAVTSAGVAPAWSVVGHSRIPAFHFAPHPRLLLDERALATPADWELQRRTSGFRYAPAYANGFAEPATQLAAFRRGDSALVVAAWDLSADSLLGAAPLRAALLLQPAADSAPATARDPAARAVGTLVLQAPWHRALLALEMVDSAGTRAARHRVTLDLPPRAEGLQLSDLLLYRVDGPVEATLESVLPHAIATNVVHGARVGVFWETYGLRAGGEPVSVAMTLRRVGAPFVRRAAEALGLADRASPLRVQWREQPDARTGIAARVLTVDLSSLAPGRYLLRLVSQSGARRAESARELVIH